MKTTFILATAAIFVGVNAQAASIKVANKDIELSGGISGAFFASNNNGPDLNGNDLVLTDALLELSSGELKREGVGFTAAIGGFTGNSLYDGGIGSNYNAVNADSVVPFNYGWASVSPIENVVLDLGVIATTIGNESAASYANGNILRGILWNAQPAYYRGMRGTYNLDDLAIFGEFNKDESQGSSKSIALGVSGKMNDIGFSGTYSYGDGGNDILDVVVNAEVMDIKVGGNLDLFIVEDPVGDASSSVVGVGLYAVPTYDKNFSFPIRIEFVNNGKGLVYGREVDGAQVGVGGNAFSFTVTPTMHFKKNGYLRAEIAFIKTDEKIFLSDNNDVKNQKPSIALQTGYMF